MSGSKRIGIPRDRLIQSAHKLLGQDGINGFRIDAVLDEAACAKASLYDHFDSKTDLIIAALDYNAQIWTKPKFTDKILSGSCCAKDQLLAVFDILYDWHNQFEFEGCIILRALQESEPGSPIYLAAKKQQEHIFQTLQTVAEKANLAEPDAIARTWLLLVSGSSVLACSGDHNAAVHAKTIAENFLQNCTSA